MAKKATAPKADPEVIDVAPENPDLALARREGSSITSFVTGMVTFFNTAQSLERAATSQLASAQAWQLPRSQEQDERICREVRAISEAKKELEEHWQITAIVHKFHRRLTAHRDRPIRMLEQAAEIGNRLHLQYKRAEEERVREENARRYREEEERARKAREAELAELERVAAEKEAASPQLSERELLFVSYYLQTGNARVAAQRAGFKDADVQSMRLLKSPKIQAAISAKEEAEAARRQAEAKRAMPVITDYVTEAEPDVARGSDRTTRAADLFDERAFIAAVLDGTSPVPKEDLQAILTVRPTVLNGYARQLGERINQWPGVKLKSTTRIV